MSFLLHVAVEVKFRLDGRSLAPTPVSQDDVGFCSGAGCGVTEKRSAVPAPQGRAGQGRAGQGPQEIDIS